MHFTLAYFLIWLAYGLLMAAIFGSMGARCAADTGSIAAGVVVFIFFFGCCETIFTVLWLTVSP